MHLYNWSVPSELGLFFFELYQKIIIQGRHVRLLCGDRQDATVLAYTAFSIPPEFLIFTEKPSCSILIYFSEIRELSKLSGNYLLLDLTSFTKSQKNASLLQLFGRREKHFLKISLCCRTVTSKCCMLWICFIVAWGEWIYGFHFILWFFMFQLQRHEYNWYHAWNQARIKEFFSYFSSFEQEHHIQAYFSVQMFWPYMSCSLNG